MPSVLVTGSCGLIGSEVSVFLAGRGFRVTGIDSNHRAVFFGPDGDTPGRSTVFDEKCRVIGMSRWTSVIAPVFWPLFRDLRPDLIVHTAAQPSHDRAAAFRSSISKSTPSAR